MLISPSQLAALAPDCDAEVIAPALSAAAEEREINTARRLAHWTGQMAHESAGFTRTEENLSYSAVRLCQVWPGRFPTLGAAKPYARNPEKLAERVYGGRLGNIESGNGWKFRGRGYLMATGRETYSRYGHMLGVDLIEHPELAAEPVTGARIAAAFWFNHGLNELADADDIKGITRAINGGIVGLAERTVEVAKAKRIFGIQQT